MKAGEFLKGGRRRKKTVLAIAGFDPSGGAGMTADLMVFSGLGLSGVSVITALTAQNPKGVRAVWPVPSRFVRKECDVLLEETRPCAVKIGMLATAANVRAVARVIEGYGLKNIVLDPVLCSTSGYPLLERDALGEMKRLVRLVDVLTPNLAEAAFLTGLAVKTPADMEPAASKLFCMGARNVVIKGGHLEAEPMDLLFDGRRFHWFRGKRIKVKGQRLHGTGCRFSSAMVAHMAKGLAIAMAVKAAKGYVEAALIKA